MSDVREKLFDTTNRLSRCTSLLQRMVEENAKLRYSSYSLSYLHSWSDLTLLREKNLRQEITEAKVPGNNKRRAEGDGESSQDVAAGKRSRPAARGDVAARGHGGEAETEESADDVMSLTMNDLDEIPVELRVAVLRSRVLQMEEEVKRLRCLIQARSGEFAEERKQLVGKLMASEQARRECEAALETNDTMWQQLVQNQMAALQQKIAAQ